VAHPGTARGWKKMAFFSGPAPVNLNASRSGPITFGGGRDAREPSKPMTDDFLFLCLREFCGGRIGQSRFRKRRFRSGAGA